MTVKLLRTSILDEAQRDYVRTSMSRGRSRSGILYRHVLKNTLVPVLTFLAMTVADLLAAASSSSRCSPSPVSGGCC